MNQFSSFYQLQDAQRALETGQPNMAPINQPSQPTTKAPNNASVHTPTPPTPTTQEVAGRVLSKEQVAQAMEQLKVQNLTQPVKINQPSYLVTEEQMRYLLGIAQSNPQQVEILRQTQKSHIQPQGINAIDTLANATLGTVGRVGHTLTGLVDSIVDIFTLGYAKK